MYEPPAGKDSPGMVPPVRFSQVPPAVAKNDLPAWSSQKTRGRTTARSYLGRSAQPSAFTSPRAWPFTLPSSVRPHRSESGVEYHSPPSVAPLVDALNNTCRSGFVSGRFDTRLTTPLIAPAPYKDDATPLITSTRPRSSGGICMRPSDTCSPKSGRPSDRKRV